MNLEIWKPEENVLYETKQVFGEQIKILTEFINTYWYNGKAKNQSMNIVRKILKQEIKKTFTRKI